MCLGIPILQKLDLIARSGTQIEQKISLLVNVGTLIICKITPPTNSARSIARKIDLPTHSGTQNERTTTLLVNSMRSNERTIRVPTNVLVEKICRIELVLAAFVSIKRAFVSHLRQHTPFRSIRLCNNPANLKCARRGRFPPVRDTPQCGA